MDTKPTGKLGELNQHIPRPLGGSSKRHMIAIDPESYGVIDQLSETLDTTKGRVVSALVQFYTDTAE